QHTSSTWTPPRRVSGTAAPCCGCTVSCSRRASRSRSSERWVRSLLAEVPPSGGFRRFGVAMMNDGSMVSPISMEELVGRITDEFLERLDRGDQPQVEDYARRYPEAASEIRQVFPALD